MAKRSNRVTEEIPPSLGKEQGARVLTAMKEKGETLLTKRPVLEAAYNTWSNATLEYIKKVFGSHSGHISTFIGQIQIRYANFENPRDENVLDEQSIAQFKTRLQVLESLIDQLKTDIAIESTGSPSAQPAQLEFWSFLHPTVISIAKPRFESGHFADAVEAVLKELNSRIKEHVKRKTGNEFDGADLMRRAFSPNNPVITLADLSTESGRNEQQGFMDIFAGTMTGIRNPKAHGNIDISPERAIHHLFLASLLFSRFDERL